MKNLVFISFVISSIISANVYAWGALQSQEVDGFSRYCTYSDGSVLTVGSAGLCPISNSGVKSYGSPTINIEKRSVGFGSLTRQRVNGFSRYCTYSNGAVLTVGSTDLCPISDK